LYDSKKLPQRSCIVSDEKATLVSRPFIQKVPKPKEEKEV
jgi:hypothetical protein